MFGGVGNDSFDLSGGVATASVIDTGSGADSVLLGASGDSITLTVQLTHPLQQEMELILWSLRPTWLPSIVSGSGADTLNFTAGSASIIGTTIKGDDGIDKISRWSERCCLQHRLPRFDFWWNWCRHHVVHQHCSSNSIQAGSGSDSIVMSGTGVEMSSNRIDLGAGTDT